MNFGIGTRGIIGRFYNLLEGAVQASWASQVAMYFRSDQEQEIYRWLGMTPPLRQWVGGRQPKGLREDGMTITNELFEATMELSVDDRRRDKTGQINVRIGDLARRAAAHWNSLLSTLIINGAGSTSGLCYDGQYFFDTDHSEGSSGTQKNLLTASEVASLAVTVAANPTALEMSRAILGAIGHMMTYKDDYGEPMHEDARSFLLMVPPTLAGAAVGAINTNVLASGVDNPLKAAPFTVNYAMNPRLSSWSVDFCIFRTDAPTKPFIMQEELGAEMSAIAEGTEEEFKNNRHLFGVKASRNVGFGMWQHAVKCTLSAAG